MENKKKVMGFIQIKIFIHFFSHIIYLNKNRNEFYQLAIYKNLYYTLKLYLIKIKFLTFKRIQTKCDIFIKSY